MNFQTMSKQRKFVFISAIVGIVSMFLPWIKISIFGMSQSVNGMHEKYLLVFGCFVVAAILAYMGDQTKNLAKTNWFITLVCGAVAVLLIILFYSDSSGATFGMASIGFGFYLAALSAIGVLVSAYMFKSANDSIKSGFDNLKNDISEKTKSDNPPNSNT